MINRSGNDDAGGTDLPTVNRVAVMLVHTEAYTHWAKMCFEEESVAPQDADRLEPTVYLIPEGDAEPQRYVRRHYKKMLIEELTSWCTDEAAWPSDLSYRTFQAFFDVHVASMVVDLATEPLERDG